MKRYILILIFFSLPGSASLQAKMILREINFDEGNWVLVGVPLHNYKLLPIQKELGTFIIRNDTLLKEIRENWDFPLTFEDKCDYHYELKFYRDEELQLTLRLNLYCGYITYDDMSYEFNTTEFERIRLGATPIDWSRISFVDMDLLKSAVATLDTVGDIFWYEDVKPYYFSGYTLIGLNELPWYADLDSLQHEVENSIRNQAEEDSFYLKPYFHIIRGDNLYVRYFVHCERDFAESEYAESDLLGNQFLRWRSHLADKDSVSIVAIGLDKLRYRELMEKALEKEWYDEKEK
jgi:hypothetical protein